MIIILVLIAILSFSMIKTIGNSLDTESIPDVSNLLLTGGIAIIVGMIGSFILGIIWIITFIFEIIILFKASGIYEMNS